MTNQETPDWREGAKKAAVPATRSYAQDGCRFNNAIAEQITERVLRAIESELGPLAPVQATQQAIVERLRAAAERIGEATEYGEGAIQAVADFVSSLSTEELT